MGYLKDAFEENPYNQPGRVHRLDDAYFKKLMQLNLR